MLAVLATVDALSWAAIVVKALVYGATLLAGGAVLVRLGLPGLDAGARAGLVRMAVLSAIGAAVLSALRVPLQAGFLMGGTWQGMTEPAMLSLVMGSPLGDAIGLRLAGLALILCVLWPGAPGRALSAAGAALVAASFALRGHVVGPDWPVLAPLLMLHIWCLSFWLAALWPLARAARLGPPAQAGALAEAFGRRALWAVGALVLAGGAMLVQFGVVNTQVLSTPYGQIFMLKLSLFALVLGLAGWNKLRLTPALLAGRPGAGAHLRRSIAFESAALAAMICVTAALTTLSAP